MVFAVSKRKQKEVNVVGAAINYLREQMAVLESQRVRLRAELDEVLGKWQWVEGEIREISDGLAILTGPGKAVGDVESQ